MIATAGEMLLTSSEAEAEAMSRYNNVVFHHLSNFFAPSVLSAMFAAAIGFGIMCADIAFHIPFDVRLVRSVGWTHPLKALNRIAYFVMRFGSLLYLGLLLILGNIQGNDCVSFFEGLIAIWYTALVCMDFIFIARTVSLWAWRPAIAVPLFLLFIGYSVLGATNIALWGHAIQVPGTRFCGYVSEAPSVQPLRTRLNVYFSLALSTDFIILVLTCIRLRTVRRSSPQTMAATWSLQSIRANDGGAVAKPKMISQQLFVQGFVLYGFSLISKVASVLVYYLSDYRQSWNLMVFALALTLNMIVAGTLVRQTSDVVRKSQNQSSSGTNIRVSASKISSGGVASINEITCTACQLKRMVEQAEMDLRMREYTEHDVTVNREASDSSAAASPDKVDLELGEPCTSTTLEK